VTLILPLATYTTMVLGAYVKAVYGGLACPEWPTCMDGQVVVHLSSVQVASELFHRAAALVLILGGLVLLFLVLTAYRSARRLRNLTLLSALVLLVQVSLGALTIFSALEALVVTLHLAVATILFALSILVLQEARRVLRAGPSAQGAGSAAARGAAPAEAP
jgi:heme A synthase